VLGEPAKNPPKSEQHPVLRSGSQPRPRHQP
jgi:hypothetical protein